MRCTKDVSATQSLPGAHSRDEGAAPSPSRAAISPSLAAPSPSRAAVPPLPSMSKRQPVGTRTWLVAGGGLGDFGGGELKLPRQWVGAPHVGVLSRLELPGAP